MRFRCCTPHRFPARNRVRAHPASQGSVGTSNPGVPAHLQADCTKDGSEQHDVLRGSGAGHRRLSQPTSDSTPYFCATAPLPASNCDRHPELSWDFFADKHERTRSIFMRTELHRLIASPMHAERCAAVGLNSANAAVGATLTRSTSAPNTPLRILVITVSPELGAHPPP